MENTIETKDETRKPITLGRWLELFTDWVAETYTQLHDEHLVDRRAKWEASRFSTQHLAEVQAYLEKPMAREELHAHNFEYLGVEDELAKM